MKHIIRIGGILTVSCLLLCACAPYHVFFDASVSETEHSVESTGSETATLPATTGTTTRSETERAHSPLYIEGVSVEDVLLFFNEVCLETEYSYGGDASLVQKWEQPIYYKVYGDTTPEDLAVLADLSEQLDSIPGFPGFWEAQEEDLVSVPIHFCSAAELVDLMGDDFTEQHWGATRFWYEDYVIYDAIICIRNDIGQKERNSIIIEEVYNTLGPMQDTEYRKDSVIYQYSNENLSMSDIDVLLLKLLYDPKIICGMNAAECEAVIRSLYY